jgi:hypothetical protein
LVDLAHTFSSVLGSNIDRRFSASISLVVPEAKTYAAKTLAPPKHSGIRLDDLFWDTTAGSDAVRMAEVDRSAKLDAILDNAKWIY